MPISYVQRSFAGGELCPALYARADQAKYQSGLETCENFILMRHGGVSNRPGTRYVHTAATNATVAGLNSHRLMRFVFNADQTYVILMSADGSGGSMRFFRYGLPLLTGAGAVHTVAIPYTASQLADVRYIQSGDVITMVHRSHPPKTLSRTVVSGVVTFVLANATFAPGVSYPATVTCAPAATPTNITAGKYVRYIVTSAKSGTYEESARSVALAYGPDNPTVAAPTVITWAAVVGAVEYYIYKSSGKQDVFGYIGVSQGLTYSDTNITPDYTDSPPLVVEDLFDGPDKYPSAVSYYQQRAVYGSTNNNPEKIWMSKSGSFKNFTRSSPFKDDDAIVFTVLGREVNDIQHLIEVGSLVLFTTGGEWLALGDVDGAIKPNSINLRQQGYNGSASLTPIVVGNNILYLQARGSAIRDFRYDIQVDGFSGKDLTVFSAHMFDGYTIKAWAYQQIPHSIIWAVRSDGVLLGLTYVKEHEIAGWHRHITDGFVEDVVSVPEGTEDTIYLIVRRIVNGNYVRFVERLSSRASGEFVSIVDNSIFLDCSASYNGSNTDGTPYGSTNTSAITIEFEAPAGETPAQSQSGLTASAAMFLPTDVGNSFQVDFFNNGVIYAYTVISYVSPTRVLANSSRAYAADPNAAPPENKITTKWVRCVNEISGITWLVGKTVGILADGNVHPTQVVSAAGKVTLQQPFGHVHVGLQYKSTVKTLAIDVMGQETMSDKHKSINRVSLFVESSRGIFIGPDATSLKEYKQRTNEMWGSPTRLKTGVIDVSVVSKWDKVGQLVVVQSDPLPLSILSIIPRMSSSTQ